MESSIVFVSGTAKGHRLTGHGMGSGDLWLDTGGLKQWPDRRAGRGKATDEIYSAHVAMPLRRRTFSALSLLPPRRP